MRTLLYPIVVLSLASCGHAGTPDDKVGSDSRTFDQTGFDRVVLAGPDSVTVFAGSTFAVRAEGDKDVLDRLQLKVEDGELRVGRIREEGSGWSSHGRARVSVTMPQIRGATISGAGRMTIDRAEAPAFEGTISGAGDFRLGELKAQTASFRLLGAGNLDLGGGQAGTLDLTLSGAGNVSASKVTARDLSVSVSGVGQIDARATGTATGRVSGVGSVTVRGTDRCDIKRSGVGSVTCKL